MQKFFEIFGKIMLVLLILGGLTYAGFYFGKQTKTTEELVKSDEEKVFEQIVPTLTTKPSALVTIVAGLPKSAGLSFDQYSITTPDGWASKKESQTALDEKFIIEKDGYSISIFQAASGGALCLYPGDADFEGPSSKFEKFVNLTTKDSRNLRRSQNAPSENTIGTSFTVCQKSADGSYQQPTNYGHISIKLPSAWDDEGLKVVDSIISSLKKI
jgi:hypothetical protein